MKQYSFYLIATLLILNVAHTPKASADTVRQAVETVHDFDAKGQAFTLSIAAVGGTGAIALGTWLLYDRPLAQSNTPSKLLFSNGLLMVSAGVGQFVHGFMRLGERRASAAAARLLLDDPNATQESLIHYLRYRAQQSGTTRLVGAVITTLQGLVGLTAGLELALTDHSSHAATGWVVAGLSVLGTGVGAVHFFGKTRAQRELAHAVSASKSTSSISLELAPTVLTATGREFLPGVVAVGRF